MSSKLTSLCKWSCSFVTFWDMRISPSEMEAIGDGGPRHRRELTGNGFYSQWQWAQDSVLLPYSMLSEENGRVSPLSVCWVVYTVARRLPGSNTASCTLVFIQQNGRLIVAKNSNQVPLMPQERHPQRTGFSGFILFILFHFLTERDERGDVL